MTFPAIAKFLHGHRKAAEFVNPLPLDRVLPAANDIVALGYELREFMDGMAEIAIESAEKDQRIAELEEELEGYRERATEGIEI